MSIKQCQEFEPLEICSGHGVCNTTTGLCECDENWTSLGDFVPWKGLACSVHVHVVRGLWVLSLIASMALFSICYKFFNSRFKIAEDLSKRISKDNMTSNEHSHFSSVLDMAKKKSNDPSFIFPFLFLVSSTSNFILSVLKIIDPEKFAIGNDPYTTLCCTGFIVCLVIGVAIFEVVLVNFLVGYSKMMSTNAKNRIRTQGEWIKRIMYFFSILFALLCDVPLFLLGYPEHYYDIYAAFYGVLILLCLVVCGTMLLSLSTIIQEINNYIASQEVVLAEAKETIQILQTVKSKLIKTRLLILVIGPNLIITHLIFIYFKFLAINTAYILPLLFANAQAFAYATVYNLINNRLNTKSSSDDGKDNRSGDAGENKETSGKVVVAPLSRANTMSNDVDSAQNGSRVAPFEDQA